MKLQGLPVKQDPSSAASAPFLASPSSQLVAFNSVVWLLRDPLSQELEMLLTSGSSHRVRGVCVWEHLIFISVAHSYST